MFVSTTAARWRRLEGFKEKEEEHPWGGGFGIPGMCLMGIGVHLFKEEAKIEEINPLIIYFHEINYSFLFLFDIDKDFSYDYILKKKNKNKN